MNSVINILFRMCGILEGICNQSTIKGGTRDSLELHDRSELQPCNAEIVFFLNLAAVPFSGEFTLSPDQKKYLPIKGNVAHSEEEGVCQQDIIYINQYQLQSSSADDWTDIVSRMPTLRMRKMVTGALRTGRTIIYGSVETLSGVSLDICRTGGGFYTASDCE